MRCLALASIVLGSSLASAAPADLVDAALGSSTLHNLFAKTVQIHGLVFPTQDCQELYGKARTVSGNDQTHLAECIQIFFHSSAFPSTATKVPLNATDASLAVIVLTLGGGKIVAITPYGATAADGDLPTFAGLILTGFEPTDKTKQAIGTLAEKQATARIKVCHDAGGAVTSRRLVDSSGLAAFDAEAVKMTEATTKVSLQTAPKPIAACDITEMRYPTPKDLVQPIAITRVAPSGGGDVPPPPDTSGLIRVVPTMLEPLRIAGDMRIPPDDKTKVAIQRAGKGRVVASLKLCVDDKGDVLEVRLLKSSGFPEYDQQLDAAMHRWKYKPYIAPNSTAPVGVCTAVTFVYSQT